MSFPQCFVANDNKVLYDVVFDTVTANEFIGGSAPVPSEGLLYSNGAEVLPIVNGSNSQILGIESGVPTWIDLSIPVNSFYNNYSIFRYSVQGSFNTVLTDGGIAADYSNVVNLANCPRWFNAQPNQVFNLVWNIFYNCGSSTVYSTTFTFTVCQIIPTSGSSALTVSPVSASAFTFTANTSQGSAISSPFTFTNGSSVERYVVIANITTSTGFGTYWQINTELTG